MKTIEIYSIDPSTKQELPFTEGGVKAGFPSPAQDYEDLTIDLNRDLVPHPESTFVAKVLGESMRDAGFNDGDLMVIDRNKEPYHGCKAICCLNGEFTVKELDLHDQKNGVIYLKPYNPEFKPIKVTPDMDLIIWGVVIYVIHKMI